MPRRYPVEVRRQVVEFARSGTNVGQVVATFGMSEATIYTWLRQQQIDRGRDLGHEHRYRARSRGCEASTRPDPAPRFSPMATQKSDLAGVL